MHFEAKEAGFIIKHPPLCAALGLLSLVGVGAVADPQGSFIHGAPHGLFFHGASYLTTITNAATGAFGSRGVFTFHADSPPVGD
jgi:hypothetical protein